MVLCVTVFVGLVLNLARVTFAWENVLKENRKAFYLNWVKTETLFCFVWNSSTYKDFGISDQE